MLLNLIYAIGLLALSPIVAYRNVRHGRYQRGVGEKLWGLPAERANEIRGGASRLIWLHAVSVGEVNLLPELVKRLRIQDPDAAIAISSSTDTGYDLACQHFGSQCVFFCPLDFTWAVRRTLANLQCNLLVLAELEIWPNLIAQAHREGCEIAIVNGRLSETSGSRYASFKRFLGPTFARLSVVGCQDEGTLERFAACGTPRSSLQLTGSLKFDNAPDSRDTPEVTKLINWSGVDAWHRIWCVGSTQPGEEAMALRVYGRLRQHHPELRLILVPRHVERFDAVADEIRQAGLREVRRSRGDSQFEDVWESDEVILIDTIGELRNWWGVCHVATVGGSFGDRGGQNMLEPAGYGCAVSFGPNTKNFKAIADQLIGAHAAIRVTDENELETFVARCLNDIPAADSLGRNAKRLVGQHRGAYTKTQTILLPFLGEKAVARRAA